MSQGIILLGHGSKAPQAEETLNAITKQLEQVLDNYKVVAASMEFNKPDIPESIAALAAQGVTKIIVLPYFLFFGIHLQEDIPQILEEQKAKYPYIQITMANNIGADPRMVGILVDRLKEVS